MAAKIKQMGDNHRNPEGSGRLVDSHGRVHTNLRVSVTDRCNIRCFYCMPASGVHFQHKSKLLTYEEIVRVVRVFSRLGVDKIRLTGGEPLVRADLPILVKQLSGIRSLRDIALTTNGMLLADHAADLRRAGLRRVNISLDSLDESVFEKITRRTGLNKVLEGIEAAQQAGFEKVRLNAIAITGLTESQVIPLVKFARQKNLELRFIEFMPLDAGEQWTRTDVLTGARLREMVAVEFGELRAIEQIDPSQPATDYQYADRDLKIGFIDPVSQPFCQSCNRLRLTADGQIRNCLFSTEEWNAKSLIRGGGSDEELASLIRNCVAHKKAAHGIDKSDFARPQRAMYQIGG